MAFLYYPTEFEDFINGIVRSIEPISRFEGGKEFIYHPVFLNPKEDGYEEDLARREIILYGKSTGFLETDKNEKEFPLATYFRFLDDEIYPVGNISDVLITEHLKHFTSEQIDFEFDIFEMDCALSIGMNERDIYWTINPEIAIMKQFIKESGSMSLAGNRDYVENTIREILQLTCRHAVDTLVNQNNK